MKTKLLIAIATLLATIALTACNNGAEPQTQGVQETQAADCDRQCLENMMKQYLNALVQHDPSAVPFAADVKFTENTAHIPVGEGLWVTATEGPSDFQIYAADPVAQQVACLVMMKETNKPVLLGARLKLVNGKITEAEHLAVRDELNAGQLANLEKVRPALLEDLPPEDRTPRDQMLAAGEAYYVALTGEDGKLAPFAPGCERRENGMTTAGTGEQQAAIPISNPDPDTRKMMEVMAKMPRDCEGQISTGAFTYITDIKERRVPIADEQKGLVVGFSMFWHKSDVKEYKVKGVPGIDTAPSFQGTFNLPAMHIYKIRQGKIHEIEAIGFQLPYGLTSGW